MTKSFITTLLFINFFAVCFFSIKVSAQYTQAKHHTITDAVIPVSKPGSYAVPGATYMLANNIFSSMSAIFLGKVGNPSNGANVKIINKMGDQIVSLNTKEDGTISSELLEYSFDNSQKSYSSPYNVVVGKVTETVSLNKNKEIIVKK